METVKINEKIRFSDFRVFPDFVSCDIKSQIWEFYGIGTNADISRTLRYLFSVPHLAFEPLPGLLKDLRPFKWPYMALISPL